MFDVHSIDVMLLYGIPALIAWRLFLAAVVHHRASYRARRAGEIQEEINSEISEIQ